MKTLGIIFLLLISAKVSSATMGTLMLRGQISQNLSLDIYPDAVASNLDFNAKVVDLKIATVNEKSNSKNGYKVAITSVNLGKLKRVSGTEIFAYSVKYNNVAVNLANASGTIFSNTGINNGTVGKSLTISYNGVDSSLMTAGTYEDQITMTITAQ